MREQKNYATLIDPLPWRAGSHQLAQDQTQIESSHMNQLPLQNILMAPQMRASHAAGIVAVSKAALDQLSTLSKPRSASRFSTHPNTSPWVSSEMRRRVREIVE